MAWISSVLGSTGLLPTPLKASKQDEAQEGGADGADYTSPLVPAGRSQSIDSWNTGGSTEASDQDGLSALSPPSASSRQAQKGRQDTIPEQDVAPGLVPQRLDLESKAPGNERGDDEKVKCEEGKGDYSHKLMPKWMDFETWSWYCNFGAAPIQPTTWMVRNVPNTYTQLDLMAELEDLGFVGAFNFLYMPVDKSSKASVGYAFVNFIAPSCSKRFAAAMQGHKFTRKGKNKEASISVAHMQGFAANLAYYESCAMKSSKVAKNRPFILPVCDEILPMPR